MKKKFMITAAIAALTLVGGYLGKSAADRTYGLSDLQLANAEALAQIENPSYKMQCIIKVDYTGGFSMPLHCATCSFQYGYVPIAGTSTCPQ